MRKIEAQRIHAKKRALERYGLMLNRHDLHEIVSMIRNGGANFVSKQSNRVSVYELVFKDVFVRVVYDCERKTLVTFLPKDADLLKLESETDDDSVQNVG